MELDPDVYECSIDQLQDEEAGRADGIDAKFTADFSQFDSAVKAASGTLKKLEGDAATTATQVNKLATSSATSFKSASTATQDWTKDLGKFDGILSAAGVNISSQVRAITELKAATSGAAGTLTTFATAGVAAGVALAGLDPVARAQEFLVTNAAAQDFPTTLRECPRSRRKPQKPSRTPSTKRSWPAPRSPSRTPRP